jgi:Uma2 family endonuclease
MSVNSHSPMTVEAFEAFLERRANGHQLWELIDGKPVERGTTREQGMIVSRLIYLLYNHTHKYGQGRVGTSIRHHQAGDAHNVRMPNVAYYADGRRPIAKEGFAPVYPDLAIEVKALNEDDKAMTDRGMFYLSRGAKLVWLVYPDQKLIDVMAGSSIKTLTSGNVLTGGDVLPKFSVPVAEIFQCQLTL